MRSTVIHYTHDNVTQMGCILLVFFVFVGALRLSGEKLSSEKQISLNWKSLPKTWAGWLRLALVPAKTYAAFGYPFLILCLAFFSANGLSDETPQTAPLIIRGYFFVVLALGVGTFLQLLSSRFWYAVETLSYLLLAIWFGQMTGSIDFYGR